MCIRDRLKERGYGINNIDCTLVAEAPKIRPHVPEMTANIASVLGIGEERVSVKATTNEKMGFVGREEGMACFAVCTLKGEEA